MHKLYKLLMDKKIFFKKILPIGLLRTLKTKLVKMKVARYKKQPINKEKFLEKPMGVNLIGDIRAEIGLGQSMRLVANELDLSKYDFVIQNFQLGGNVRRNDTTWDHKMQKDAHYNINLFHINPYEIGMAYMYLDKEIWKDRYNIAFWLWELEELPEDYKKVIKFFDEIWTPSEFASNSIRKATSKPVHTIPYYVTAACDPKYNREYFGLPDDKFLYLVMFDSNSTMSRKNPVGAIEAFKKAFSKDDQEVGLVIKVNNPAPENIDFLQSMLKGYNNVYYITKVMDKIEVNSLIADVDVFLSLHRAEGFGLVMAEAMLLRTACIATNWSSNTEFMNSKNACMLSCKMTKIQKSEGCYEEGGTWAEPSIDEAAMYMRKLKEDVDFYQQIVDNAYVSVSEQLGETKIVQMLETRLDDIYRKVRV